MVDRMHLKQPTPPAATSQQLATLAGVVPFLLPPVTPINQNTPCGTGMICPVTASQNSPTVVKHGLGRKVQFIIPLANNGGALVPPILQWGTSLPGGVNTPNTLTVQSTNVAMTSAMLFVF
jgi:hypothetical protein